MFKLFKSVREYKKYAILAPLFMVGEVVLECLIPLMMTNIIREGRAVDPNINRIILYCSGIILMAMFSLLCGVLSGRMAAVASTGFAKNLREDLYCKVQDFSFSNIDKFSTASLVTRMTTDISNIQMAFGMLIRVAIRVPMMLIFSVACAFIINPQLSWLYIAIIPVLGFILLFISHRTMKIFDDAFEKYDDLNESIEENIKGIRVVKTYVKEEHEIAKFNKTATVVKEKFTKGEVLISLNSPVMQFFVYIVLVTITIVGAYIIVDSNQVKLSLESISALTSYGIQILMSLMSFSMIFFMLSFSAASMRRVGEVLKETPDIANPENPLMEVEDGSICFENVSFKYKDDAEKFALEKINLSIASGETIGIIGSTGSAKTTLINLISRLYDTTEGTVYVSSKDVRAYDLQVLRDSVAVVLQKNLLFSGTINENLRWGDPNATDAEIKHACKLACADTFIESFPNQYETRIEQGGTNVSGGQKQRLCIARALLKKPKILILDDSTSAVDTKTDAIIKKSLRTELPNTTKIIIAQRVSSIEEADKIIVMDAAGIHGIGTHDELIKTDAIYQEVYEIQNRVGGEQNV